MIAKTHGFESQNIFFNQWETLINISNTFLCKIMKRELKCIFKLCAAILQDLEHPKNRPPISLSHTIECVWERRTSMFLVLDTNLCSQPTQLSRRLAHETKKINQSRSFVVAPRINEKEVYFVCCVFLSQKRFSLMDDRLYRILL